MNNKKQLNYYGFVEGADISNGITNVIVTDGFTGNIALKTAEGTASMVQSYFKKAFEKFRGNKYMSNIENRKIFFETS